MQKSLRLKAVLFLISIFLFGNALTLNAQQLINILLVDDDNYSSPDHTPRIETAITDAGYSYTMFNAQDSAASPTAAFMQNFDLVVWYTANDGVGHYFWNGQDTVNTELQSYLDNGGMLWAMGNDIIYDRFGGAPDTFATGEFLYDYMGVSSYDVQSKVNDGGIGVPMLIRVPGQTISMMDTIKWYVSGLWYGDGCTPVVGAVPVYEFGPGSYVLAGYKTSIYYDNGTSRVFGCYWDPYYMDADTNRANFFNDVLNWFEGQLVDIKPVHENNIIPQSFVVKQNYPNPFNPTTTIPYRISKPGRVRISVYNLRGQNIATFSKKHQQAGIFELKIDGSNWASGIYLYNATFNGMTLSKKMLLVK